MLFWVFIAVLTFVALLSVLLPLGRARTEIRDRLDYDRELYKARVNEIERDRELGRISSDAADAAIADEGRKLISLSQGSKGNRNESASRSGAGLYRATMIGSIFAVPAAAIALYLYTGNPGVPDQTLASRINQAPDAANIEELVARAEAHLARNPQDARGWAVLAPVYARLGRFDEATQAWRAVYRLAPETPDIRATLAESIIAAADGMVTEEARELFEQEAAADAGSERARFYLALAASQEGRHQEAVDAWNDLISNGNPQAAWMEPALRFRRQSADAAGITLANAPAPGASAPKGPTSEDIAAAAGMTAEDRMAMIGTMVEGLAERLAEDPSDKDGWQQLIRSYIVLGREDEAREAINQARAHHEGDQAFSSVLERFAKQLPDG